MPQTSPLWSAPLPDRFKALIRFASPATIYKDHSEIGDPVTTTEVGLGKTEAVRQERCV